VPAVDDVSFEINEGEIVGFLGPNGAGKTTTMNILTGYISATAGEVKINGFDVNDSPEKAKKCLGYLPDNPPLYDEMLVREYLSFICDIKGVRAKDRNAVIEDVSRLVQIDDVLERLLKNLSKGYRQRVGLAQALVGSPKALILDEPTVGLDPKQIVEMRDVIKTLGESHTIMLSSHILSEVSAMCDRVIIINKGKIVASGTTAELSQSVSQGKNISVRLRGERDEVQKILTECEFVKEASFIGIKENETVDFEVSGAGNADVREVLFGLMSEAGIPILQMKPVDLSLEDVFLQITGGAVA
jgi:ABC-2 type transport system ATP-binding protein